VGLGKDRIVKYFLDTEFIERPCTIDLISIGLVCEDGREFYAESGEIDWTKASDWVLANVRPHLTGDLSSRREIADGILDFTNGGYGEPEFVGYYSDYDWVVFCWLFGSMMDLPKGYPMYCIDLKQMAAEMGNPELPAQDGTEHHALADARWNKRAWEYLAARKELTP
jgi:hypothetical protein